MLQFLIDCQVAQLVYIIKDTVQKSTGTYLAEIDITNTMPKLQFIQLYTIDNLQ